MLICATCLQEMRCQKNGVGVDFGHGWTHSSDLYTCPGCGASILNANNKGYYDPEHKTHDHWVMMPSPVQQEG